MPVRGKLRESPILGAHSRLITSAKSITDRTTFALSPVASVPTQSASCPEGVFEGSGSSRFRAGPHFVFPNRDYASNVTVGIAALCVDEEGRPAVVIATDRMVTYPGFIEFEHGVPKMIPMSPGAVAMTAGDALTASRLTRDVGTTLYGTSPLVAQIAQQLATAYEMVRHQRIESHVLSPRGLNFQTFYQAHASLNGQITVLIDQTMMQFDLGVEILIGGIDPTGTHIHSVHNPGRTDLQHDMIGYAAIGSGAIHALQAMIGFRHTDGAALKETVYRVYAAKRRSEAAPGVGSGTDMAIISRAGVKLLVNEQIEALAQMFVDVESRSRADLQENLTTLTLEATPLTGEDGPGETATNDDTDTDSADTTTNQHA